MAAAVLAVGKFEQSPNEKTFLYVRCWSVLGLTSTYPDWSTSFDLPTTSGEEHGGDTCNISYCIDDNVYIRYIIYIV